jgi:hypothetical protein
MAMFGLTNQSAAELAPLARSWRRAPKLIQIKGCSTSGYKKEERAYHLTAKGPAMSFKLQASKDSPIVNPCFVIKNWGPGKAGVKIDGKAVKSGKGFRQGIIRDTDGTQTLIVWLETESQKPVEISIKKN